MTSTTTTIDSPSAAQEQEEQEEQEEEQEQEQEQHLKQTKKVLIIGAGPAGLLAAILFLRRNNNNSNNNTRYQVTLVDPGVDHGKLDAEGLKKKRSWMIALSAHGLAAIRTVPQLFEDYVKQLGVDIQHATYGLTSTWFVDANMERFIQEGASVFTVDRNYICAGLARYLNDHFLKDATTSIKMNGVDESETNEFVSHYETAALFVDGENHSVICRPNRTSKMNENNNNDFTLDYDLLLGCDGIRSVVRNAFLTTHRDFCFDIKDLFGVGKAMHLALPHDGSLKDGTFMFLNNPIPNAGSFILPETDQMTNVNIGFKLDTKIAPELESKDAAVVSAYLKRHFKAFSLDCDEVGKQWVAQGWSTTGQVHCSFYHSHALSALLMGDAAHATSPQIGQGMNTALADAVALDELLNEHKNNFDAVLSAFSVARVKEGHALTDLSFYTFSISGSQQFRLMLRQQLHTSLHRILPWLVRSAWPMDDITLGGKLSVAYEKMVRNGVLGSVRRVNDDIMREHFETTNGMVRTNTTTTTTLGCSWFTILAAAVASVAAFYTYGVQHRK